MNIKTPLDQIMSDPPSREFGNVPTEEVTTVWKLSPILEYISAALVLGVCIIIAACLVEKNGRYIPWQMEDRAWLLDSRTGDLYSTYPHEGPVMRFDKDGNWMYEGPGREDGTPIEP